MMNKLIFGRFIPGDSFIHKLDPRVKLLASFYFIGIIFWQTIGRAIFWRLFLRYLAFFFPKLIWVFSFVVFAR